MKAEFKRHFECRFTETNYVQPTLDGVSLDNFPWRIMSFLKSLLLWRRLKK